MFIFYWGLNIIYEYINNYLYKLNQYIILNKKKKKKKKKKKIEKKKPIVFFFFFYFKLNYLKIFKNKNYLIYFQ